MKGIILAGGSGTRLAPLTNVISKQLLPVYDKPMIYYPLTTLILAGIKEILVITRPEDLPLFKGLLKDGESFGINIEYAVQNSPAGLAQAPLIAEDFLDGNSFCLILGDNFLYGPGLGRNLNLIETDHGAHIFAYHVENPSAFGVIELDEHGKPISIVEKPNSSISNLAIPGLKFFDKYEVNYCKKIKPSGRGELEITDLLRIYMNDNKLNVQILPIGTAWLDMGTFDDLHKASEFVKLVQNYQNILIGDPITASKFAKERDS